MKTQMVCVVMLSLLLLVTSIVPSVHAEWKPNK